MPENDRKSVPRGNEVASLEHGQRRPSAHRLPPWMPLSISGLSTCPVLMILACLFIMILFTPSASLAAQRNNGADARQSLAVLTIESVSEQDQDTAARLTDTVRNELAKSTSYSVMDRSSMITKLRDRSQSLMHCSTKECAIEAGRILGVQAVVVGSLGKVGKTAYLSLLRINIKTRAIEFAVEDKCPGETEALLLAGAQTAHKLMGALAIKLPGAPVPENERFSFRELSVFDKELALAWLRDADIARKSMTWQEANEHIVRLNKQGYLGYEDWRLPAKSELATFIEYAKGRGKTKNIHDLLKHAGFKNIQADYYWSVTSPEDDPGLAWVLDMYSGDLSTSAKSNSCYLWPVRKEQRLFEGRINTP